MSFIKKIWKNRITEYPNRRILTKQDNSSEIVTVGRSEGVISQEGDAFSAENMNDLEDRIDNAFSNLSNDSVVLASSNPESGSIKFGINTNGQYGYIKAGADTVTPFRNPTGDATQQHVLAGKVFSSTTLENVVGTMPNNGSVTLTPTGNNTVTGDPGYYSEIIADGSAAYAAGQRSVQEGTHVFSITSGTTISTLSWNTQLGNKLIGAAVTGVSNLRFYSWQENFNAYTVGGVACNCNNGTINVTFNGTPTRQTNTGDGRVTVTITVKYWYFN